MNYNACISILSVANINTGYNEDFKLNCDKMTHAVASAPIIDISL